MMDSGLVQILSEIGNQPRNARLIQRYLSLVQGVQGNDSQIDALKKLITKIIDTQPDLLDEVRPLIFDHQVCTGDHRRILTHWISEEKKRVTERKGASGLDLPTAWEEDTALLSLKAKAGEPSLAQHPPVDVKQLIPNVEDIPIDANEGIDSIVDQTGWRTVVEIAGQYILEQRTLEAKRLLEKCPRSIQAKEWWLALYKMTRENI